LNSVIIEKGGEVSLLEYREIVSEPPMTLLIRYMAHCLGTGISFNAGEATGNSDIWEVTE
jgi:hypothetical protein